MKNTLSKIVRLLIAGVCSAGATFLIQVILTHNLSLESFGKYSFINSLLNIVGPFAAMGIAGIFLRKICLKSELTGFLLKKSFSISTVYSMLAYTFTCIVLITSNYGIYVILALASFYFPFSLQYILISYFQSKEKYSTISIIQSLFPLIRLLSICFLFIGTFTLFNVSISILCAHMVIYSIYLYIINLEKEEYIKSDFNYISYLKESLYYSVNGTINVAQIQISTITAIYLFGAEKTGLYSSANTLLTACFIIPNIVFGTFFLPKYHKLGNTLKERKIPFQHATISFVLGIIITILFYFTADLIISVIYPESFGEASKILRILFFCIPFRFFSTAIGASILTEKYVKHKVSISVIAILLQILFSIILSFEGILALSMSYVFSEVLIAFAYYIIYRHSIKHIKITN